MSVLIFGSVCLGRQRGAGGERERERERGRLAWGGGVVVIEGGGVGREARA
jgi:hypothetical protein